VGMRSGVFQKGREPSCISTSLPRLPTSAPGPPPRVRVVSGLAQAARQKIKATKAIRRVISETFNRENDNKTEKKAAQQHKRRSCRHIALAKPPAAPIKRQRHRDSCHLTKAGFARKKNGTTKLNSKATFSGETRSRYRARSKEKAPAPCTMMTIARAIARR
jgi:hypothetical protein